MSTTLIGTSSTTRADISASHMAGTVSALAPSMSATTSLTYTIRPSLTPASARRRWGPRVRAAISARCCKGIRAATSSRTTSRSSISASCSSTSKRWDSRASTNTPKGRRDILEGNLRTNGATEAEIAFMFRDFDRLRSTRRVELNAMTSPQFVAFVERKLLENGVAKIVPDGDLLDRVYTSIERGRRLEDGAEKLDAINTKDIKPPVDLEKRIKEILKRTPHIRWDAAIELIVDEVRKGA